MYVNLVTIGNKQGRDSKLLPLPRFFMGTWTRYDDDDDEREETRERKGWHNTHNTGQERIGTPLVVTNFPKKGKKKRFF